MERNEDKLDLEIQNVTIKIDPALHLAMKDLAKRRQVHVAYLYAEAVEAYLDRFAAKQAKQRISRQ